MKKIFSITIAVEDLDEAIKNYETLLGVKPTFSKGYEVLFTESGLKEICLDFKDQIAIFQLPGIRFVLLPGFDINYPLGRFIRRKGEGVFMISMEVEKIQKEKEKLRLIGKKFIFPENIINDFGTSNIIHPDEMNGVLFEIIEPFPELKLKKEIN